MPDDIRVNMVLGFIWAGHETTVGQLARLGRALDETQRLHPAVPGMIRSVAEDTQLGDYLLPKGSRAMLSTTVTHRLPELFDNPDSYRPDRYLETPKAVGN